MTNRFVLATQRAFKEKLVPLPVSRSLARRLVESEVISFSWENRNALWFGVVLTFSPAQVCCFKVLWDNFLRGNLPIPNERILSGVRGETTHIYHYFKRHDAWLRKVIVGDGRGNFWLRIPSQWETELGSMPRVLLTDGPSLIGGTAQDLPLDDRHLLCTSERP
jgi:hypothetical protein